MDAPLSYNHEQTVFLDQGTYHWVSLKEFQIDPSLSDTDLLEALIGHWAYHDHYAGQDAADQTHHALHGPYRLECIRADVFQPARGAPAQAVIQAWAEEATDGAPSDNVQKELDGRVYPLLGHSTLFVLPDLRPDAEHEWGWVVGKYAFLEYIAIDRPETTLTLVVAADD